VAAVPPDVIDGPSDEGLLSRSIAAGGTDDELREIFVASDGRETAG
jgi:hypothetical protein